jgi:hypothetical protein
MPTKNLKPNLILAIDWIEAQLLQPNQSFSHKPCEYLNDLHECLKTQKMRMISAGPLESGLAYLRTKQIKDFLKIEEIIKKNS